MTVRVILHPTKEQELKFKQFSGISRLVYNMCLDYKTKEYDNYGRNVDLQELLDYIKLVKTQIKPFIKEVPEALTKQSAKDLMVAYKNFFSGTGGFPKFKAKHKTQDSFYQRTDNLYFKENKVNLTKIGKVKYTTTYKNLKTLEGVRSGFKNPRIKYDGKYWVLTFGLEAVELKKDVTEESIGIDLGIKTLAILNDGTTFLGVKYETNYLKVYRRLQRKQRELAHKFECNLKQGRQKYHESNKIKQLKQDIRLLHRRLANTRKTYLHTVTKCIVKTKPYLITVEDLNVKGMLKNKNLSKAISEQSFYMFLQFLQYKCERYGVTLLKASRFYASSKICSECGNKKEKLTLSERVYVCDCGNTLDRDLNAARNLNNYGKLAYQPN